MPGLLVIRADASERMGSGHVMRCLALAEEWAGRGGKVHFVCRPLAGHLMAEIRERGFPVHSLPLDDSDPGWCAADLEEDAQATHRFLKGLVLEAAERVTWLLVDSYHFGAEWHARVAQAGVRLAVLDDLANRRLLCDVLIDQNALVDLHHLYPGLTPPHCRHLLGPQYALLREDVRSAAQARAQSHARNVLIFMGGADRDRLTEVVIAHWRRLAGHGELSAHVLCGAMNPHWQEVKAACEGARIGFSRAQRGMGALMSQARAAIVACGMLAVELQALEVPSLLLPLSDIQRAVALEFERRGRAVVLEPGHLAEDERFDHAWARTLAMPHHATGGGFIALDGARRVVDRMMEIAA